MSDRQTERDSQTDTWTDTQVETERLLMMFDAKSIGKVVSVRERHTDRQKDRNLFIIRS